MLLNSAFSLAAFVGLWNLLRKNPGEAIPFAWITHPSPRYRSPIDPCIAFLAMYAVVALARRWTQAPAVTEINEEWLAKTAP